MADNIQKLSGTSLNTFSIGLKANKSTITVDGTSFQLNKQLDMNSHKIINVSDPANNQDAMTLKYADDHYLNVNLKGNVNGLAELDAYGKVPMSQLPSALMEYLGAWDASGNHPTLADGSLTAKTGDTYRVSVEGTQDLGSGAIKFYVGDFVIYNGSIWERSPAADGVTSVFGRVGAVDASAGDYSASMISNDSDVSGTYVSDALNTLDGNKMNLAATPTDGDVLTTDASGQAVDSGVLLSDLATTSSLADYMLLAATPTNGHVLTTNASGQAEDSGTSLSSLTSKMELVASPTEGHVVTTNAAGQAIDSGIAASDIATTGDLSAKMDLIATPTNGNIITTNAAGQGVDSGIAASTIGDKADKVSSPTEGDLASLDATGNLVDSGIVATDVSDVISNFSSKADKVVSATATDIATLDANGNLTDGGILVADVVTPSSSNSFTNKTFDAQGTGNTISNIDTSNFASGVITDTISNSNTDLEIPTALAVYSAINSAVAPGTCQTIEIALAKVNKSSTFALPNGARVKNVSLLIETAYSAGATISAAVGAVNIMATGDNDAQTLGQYSNLDIVKIATGAVVSVTIAGAPANGAGTLFVEFVSSPIA